MELIKLNRGKRYPIFTVGAVGKLQIASTILVAGFVNDVITAAELYGTSEPIYKFVLDSNMPDFGGATTTAIVNVNDVAITCSKFTAKYLANWYDAMSHAPVQVIRGIISLESHFVNGTRARQISVLNMLNTAGIMNTFSDPTIFKCRYIVDTFKTYIEPNAKYQYAALANRAKRFLAFIPAPFYFELKSSINPNFHDLLGNFKMSYVAAGKNPDIPSTNTFSYNQDNEASKYLVPIMNVMHNDGFVTKVVPATGALAKLFYSKHTGTKKIYDIVAGQDWPMSASGVVKPEFEPDQDERAAMESMGTNVLQVINGSIQIRSNKTAFQTVLSAFNNPETLEKVFYVSDMVEPTLDGKLYKYNNADARLAIKLEADKYCDQMVADGAIESYENQCDIDNNPIEIRKAGIIVLDTVLYNAYGIRVAVHRTTIRNSEK